MKSIFLIFSLFAQSVLANTLQFKAICDLSQPSVTIEFEADPRTNVECEPTGHNEYKYRAVASRDINIKFGARQMTLPKGTEIGWPQETCDGALTEARTFTEFSMKDNEFGEIVWGTRVHMRDNGMIRVARDGTTTCRGKIKE